MELDPRTLRHGAKFTFVYAGGFLSAVLLFSIYGRGRFGNVAGEDVSSQQVWARALEVTGSWLPFFAVSVLCACLVTYILRKLTFQKFMSHRVREVVFGAMISEVWLAISLLALPVAIYANYIGAYSGLSINGQPFHGPLPNLFSLYTAMLLFLQLPVIGLCMLVFSWKKMSV